VLLVDITSVDGREDQVAVVALVEPSLVDVEF
jgi:hypothetical protein